MKNKNILLVIVLILIVGSIWYLESSSDEISNKEINEISEKSEIRIEDLKNQQMNESIETQESENQITESDLERIQEKSKKYERAKELVNPDGFINVDNITISEHIGKDVILVDFWTYSCVNCQRTLPYLTTWYDKYKDDGLVIIGIHTPEFDFEKERENVISATEKWNVTYPVVQDNDRETWYAYKNRYWPRKYIIDIDGFVVYDHIGEGAYAETELKIQELLEERNKVLNQKNEIDKEIVYFESDKGSSSKITPEIYFGYSFYRNQIGNPEGWKPGYDYEYTYPEEKEKNLFYVNGTWKSNPDDMILVSESGKIYLDFNAKNVNIVAGSEEPKKIEVYLDNQKVDEITINYPDLYRLVSLDETGDHELELVLEEGIFVNTFTFG